MSSCWVSWCLLGLALAHCSDGMLTHTLVTPGEQSGATWIYSAPSSPLRAAFREAMDECCASVGTSITTTSTPSSPNMQYDVWWWFKLAMWLGIGISVLGFSALLGLFWCLVRPWLTGRDGTGSDCSYTRGARAISEEADISSLARAQVQAFRIKNHA